MSLVVPFGPLSSAVPPRGSAAGQGGGGGEGERGASGAPSGAATRRALLGLGLAGLAAACAPRGPMHEEEIPDIDYVPVDPEKAARLLNAYRVQSGAGTLTVDPALVRIAGEYAGRLAEAGKFTHELEPWGGLEKRLHTAGYQYATAGENLGWGYRTIEQTIAGWKKSPPHDRGMKDAQMTVMGIGSAVGRRKRGDIYWCLIVAKPRAAGLSAGTSGGRDRVDAPKGTHVWGTPWPF